MWRHVGFDCAMNLTSQDVERTGLVEVYVFLAVETYIMKSDTILILHANHDLSPS